MHRLKSTSTIYRFRFAALLLCAKYVLFVVACAVMIHALIDGDHQLALLGGGLVAAAALSAIIQWILAARTGCPLCMTPVLARKKCATHRQAKAILGSHRLRVALGILFSNSFRCPYCHEPTVLEVRATKHSK